MDLLFKQFFSTSIDFDLIFCIKCFFDYMEGLLVSADFCILIGLAFSGHILCFRRQDLEVNAKGTVTHGPLSKAFFTCLISE